MPSLPFDRAVPFYDQTRADPAWVQRTITDSIIKEIQVDPNSRILEVGIGTGRIALPLLERGYPLIGLDLSFEMLLALQAKTRDTNLRVAPLQADALRLPFPDSTFDAVYAVHVYHLVENWREALGEARRVLKPGGVFMVSYHYRDPHSANRLLRGKLAEMAKEHGIDTRRPGVQSSNDVLAEMDRWGETKVVEVARWSEPTTAGKIIADLDAQIYSDTWSVPPDLLKQLIPRLQDWARAQFGDLDRELQEEARFSWLMTRKE